MNMDEWKVAYDTVLPVVNSAASLFSRMLAGVVSLSVAKAELRGILATGVDRLDNADKEFAARDAEQDKRFPSGK